MTKWVYNFGFKKAEGNASMREKLGGKGANLAEMDNLGIAVPPGFTITTEVCNYYYKNNKSLPPSLEDEVMNSIRNITESLGCVFGEEGNPLLVSVRSGGRASMPGMMDTVLNLGLNDKTVISLAEKSQDERFAFDSYRRFIQMYSDVVLSISHEEFESIIEDEKLKLGLVLDTDLSSKNWKDITVKFKNIVKDQTGKDFPQNPIEQLWGAIRSVFDSWMNQRAITYRKLNDIPDGWGTAVNVQSMVFGNMGDDCCTGVAFTRNPSNGEGSLYGEFLVNAQGEDVVAGIRNPQQLTIKSRKEQISKELSLEELMPVVYDELIAIFKKLELHYTDMQDVEFTVQKKKLWILQTRSGKRTTSAAIRIAVDMVNEKLIDKKTAINRIDAESLEQLLHPTLDPTAEKKVITKGLPASPGAAFGKVVFNSDEAELMALSGEKVLLVRTETSPEDIHGMHAAQGILTARGGMTSHAAVVARGMGRPCVSGASEITIDETQKIFFVGDVKIENHTLITINGSTGEVIIGKIPTVEPELSSYFATLMEWADKTRELQIRTNAETPNDVKVARKFGAEGIGLCRTEHMFFDSDRIISMREMILADTLDERRIALSKLEPHQKNDFVEIFKIMKGFPITIRLLDPPLHEFLPKGDDEIDQLSKSLKLNIKDVKLRISKLSELNPMLGHRGCRLGITYPEIYEMQSRAIFEAAIQVYKDTGSTVDLEIMVPLVFMRKELEIIKSNVDNVAKVIKKSSQFFPNYLVGTMIELPRAALMAGDIAESAEFFSFGTNDLTQTTFGISRDDSARFLGSYLDSEILEGDPFVSLDIDGVGELISIGATRGREKRKNLKLGICGEHGGDPKSIAFCNKIGLNYVSCSPYRIPIAKLAAAQASLNKK